MNLLPKRSKVDLDAIDRELSLPPREPREPEDFAPKPYRKEQLPDLAIKVIETFGSLPTTELDEMIKAAKQEVEAIERDAAQIKSDYYKLTAELVENIKRLTSGCALAKETLSTLRTQVLDLDINGKIKPLELGEEKRELGEEKRTQKEVPDDKVPF